MAVVEEMQTTLRHEAIVRKPVWVSDLVCRSFIHSIVVSITPHIYLSIPPSPNESVKNFNISQNSNKFS
jgi:hypothetical protein